MSLVTGGMGGLGMIASYELSAHGTPYIVSTSRSGRIAGGQTELVMMKEQLEQVTPNYAARMDATDASAMADLVQWIQNPRNARADLDAMSGTISALARKGQLSADDLLTLRRTSEWLDDYVDGLKKVIDHGHATSREEWLLKEAKSVVQAAKEVQVAAAKSQGPTPSCGQ
mmetsp:Transcript_48560/g.104643  ORF Transcript_48560/g.104643 Transcript_48560/m.104643 type:complete len:171 (+) Transcript_48560:123-635(+)